MARDREAKFKELIENRLQRTVKDIKLIGNMADKSNYKYTSDQVDEIFTELETAVEECRDRFVKQGYEF